MSATNEVERSRKTAWESKHVFRIKICGVTNPNDAIAVAESGADAVGLNFYEKSSRYVEPATSEAIVQPLASRVLRVGVFVNTSRKRIEECITSAGLGMIQLHGDESPKVVAELETLGLPVIRAFRAKTGDERRLEEFVDSADGALAGVLIDAAIAGQFGGTGHVGDWEFVARMQKRLAPLPVIVAGGLNPANVSKALIATAAYGVDTASGVETSPGVKDAQAIKSFVRAAKAGRI
jgi:phosphoribosylanthranilate isomerase